jgi:hypothetical protein
VDPFYNVLAPYSIYPSRDKYILLWSPFRIKRRAHAVRMFDILVIIKCLTTTRHMAAMPQTSHQLRSNDRWIRLRHCSMASRRTGRRRSVRNVSIIPSTQRLSPLNSRPWHYRCLSLFLKPTFNTSSSFCSLAYTTETSEVRNKPLESGLELKCFTAAA